MTFENLKNTPFVHGDKVEPEHMNKINDALPYCLDGESGGTYNPSSDIEFTGSTTIKFNAYPKLPGVTSVQRQQPLIIAYRSVGGAGEGIDDWTYSSSLSDVGAVIQNHAYTASSDALCVIPLVNLIDLATLESIDLHVEAAAHVSNMPDNRLRVALYKMHAFDGSSIVNSEVEDPYDDDSSYGSPHIFPLTGYSEIISQNTYSYYLLIKGESGSNSSNGLIIRRVVCFFNVTKLTPG